MIDTKHFKEKLENERETLENELRDLGRKNPDVPGDWQTTRHEQDSMADDPDKNVAADSVEDFVNDQSVETVIETRYNNVLAALERIENGTYGICEVSGEEIETDRLEANPAATTSKAHMNDQS